MTAEGLTRRMGPQTSIMQVGNLVNLSIRLADFLICMADCMGPTISHTNLKIGQVNRQIFKVPQLHDARLWSRSTS
jgi:hypothetical protein